MTNDDDDDDNASIEDIFDDGEDMYQIATPRTITGISKLLNTFTNDDIKAMIAETVKNSDDDTVSVLQEIIEGHTGKTMFSMLLLKEINDNINTLNVQANVFTVPKPNCYDNLKAQPTRDDLADFVRNLTDNDISGSLVYAMFEQENNADVIEALVTHVNNLSKDDMQTLVKLFSNNAILESNKSAFFAVDNKFTNNYRGLFG